MEQQKQEQTEKIKYWQARAQAFEQDKNFLQSQMIESKRQNKLLKLAIARLQGELERKEEQLTQQASIGALNVMGSLDEMKKEADGNTFMTDVKGLQDPQHSQPHPEQSFPKQPGGNQEISQIYGETTAQSSYFDSKLIPSKRLDPKRSSTRSPMSQYRHIATKNTKFEKFVDLIFKSKMQTFEIKEEIIKYVQALETSYTDAIRDLKSLIDRERAH